ncbi:hypothetical protein AX16_002716 [Volvariella volvacea WC 439]|nr:hypothetical protein AX16_002716 [Volvariella volvacea WC 439]
MVDSVSLFCLVYGQPFARAFPVNVSRGDTIGGFKKFFIIKKPNDFKGIDARFSISGKEGKLGPAKKIGKLFLTEPPEDRVHIIIKVSGQKKRAGSPLNEDFASRVKRLKVAQTTPSPAQPSTYEPIQQDLKEKILDDRLQDNNIAPVSLLYDGFGQFLDIAAGGTDSMCGFYKRRERWLYLLNKIFVARKDSSHHALAAASVGSGVEGHSSRLEGGLDRWRMPGLGITVIGSDVKFYVVLSLDTQIRLVSLTPALSCIHSASEGARILKEIPHQLFMGEFNGIRFPGVSKLLRWQNTHTKSDDFLEFQIKSQLGDPQRS